MKCVLHSIKIKDVLDLFERNPDIFKKMKKSALKKREKHARRKKRAEKKQPIFGLQDMTD